MENKVLTNNNWLWEWVSRRVSSPTCQEPHLKCWAHHRGTVPSIGGSEQRGSSRFLGQDPLQSGNVCCLWFWEKKLTLVSSWLSSGSFGGKVAVRGCYHSCSICSGSWGELCCPRTLFSVGLQSSTEIVLFFTSLILFLGDSQTHKST